MWFDGVRVTIFIVSLSELFDFLNYLCKTIIGRALYQDEQNLILLEKKK